MHVPAETGYVMQGEWEIREGTQGNAIQSTPYQPVVTRRLPRGRCTYGDTLGMTLLWYSQGDHTLKPVPW